MSVKKVLLAIASLFLIAARVFAPLPELFALNHETKQCARYWGGDEFVTYELPKGWETFEPQSSKDFIFIETDIGTCQVARDKIVAFAYDEPCCSQLGYTFVPGNIGIYKITPENIAAQKEVLESSPDIKAQATPSQSRNVVFDTIIPTAVILSVITAALWLFRNKKQR